MGRRKKKGQQKRADASIEIEFVNNEKKDGGMDGRKDDNNGDDSNEWKKRKRNKKRRSSNSKRCRHEVVHLDSSECGGKDDYSLNNFNNISCNNGNDGNDGNDGNNGENDENGDKEDVELINTRKEVRSSWFPDVIWVSRHNNQNHNHNQHPTALAASASSAAPAAAAASKNNPQHKSKLDNNNKSKLDNNNKSKLSSLVNELNQIKQILRPTAESCANAVNNNNTNNTNNNNNNKKRCNNNNKKHGQNRNSRSRSKCYNSTPEKEFREARTACNPYEVLGYTYNNSCNKKNNTNTNNTNNNNKLSQFVNRSAIKLANLDALLPFDLVVSCKTTQTSPHYFSFVDLCGAPGGFSEYILYRYVSNHLCKKSSSSSSSSDCIPPLGCYGFGMSLLGRNQDGWGIPWDLDHLKHYCWNLSLPPTNRNNHNSSSNNNNNNHNNDQDNNSINDNIDQCNHIDMMNTSTSHPLQQHRNKLTQGKKILHHHISKGADGTGNIYNWDNVIQLQHEILSILPSTNTTNTTTTPPDHHHHHDDALVDLIVADGGMDAQRDSHDQESQCYPLLLSQTAAALTLLRPKGTYILKMFGFQHHSTTRSLLRYLYTKFDSITFLKPIVSRPASAERYLVCYNYDGKEDGWDGFCWKENMMMNMMTKNDKSSSMEILSLSTEDNYYEPLDNLMDSFDTQMMELNIKTCQSIINYLETKKDAIERKNDDDDDDEKDDEDDLWQQRLNQGAFLTDVQMYQMYQEAWNIV